LPETENEKIAKGVIAMATTHPNWNFIGEWLRQITFVGEGYGCYDNFEPRKDATDWNADKRRSFITDLDLVCNELVEEAVRESHGYTYQLGSVQVEVFWWWDGDGDLVFRITGDEKQGSFAIRNTDCKKAYDWERI